MNEFGNKIKELRGNESVREAARGIGISHTYLDSLEKGVDPRTGRDRKPTLDVINKISSYYNTNLGELLNLSGVFEVEANSNDYITNKHLELLNNTTLFLTSFDEQSVDLLNELLKILNTDEKGSIEIINKIKSIIVNKK